MAPNFIAIDFETATRRMNSACSIGIAIVENGQVVDTFYSLIKPPDNCYDPNNTLIHGITENDTLDAPDFDRVWFKINKYFGPYPVLAHNAYFDMSVLSMCCNERYIKPDNFKYIDTMHLAKNIVPGSRSLVNCANYFEITIGDHHNAAVDAVICAEIALACLKHSSETDLLRFCFKMPHIMIYNFSDLQPMKEFHSSKEKQPYRKFSSIAKPSEISPQTTSFDSGHPLYKRCIVFTGELSFDRNVAMQMAVDVGAIVKGSVSTRTDMLVVGQQDLSIVGSSGMSTKERRAHEINDSGKGNIQILSEQEFMELIQQKAEAGVL